MSFLVNGMAGSRFDRGYLPLLGCRHPGLQRSSAYYLGRFGLRFQAWNWAAFSPGAQLPLRAGIIEVSRTRSCALSLGSCTTGVASNGQTS
jgi:hypothetical protein